MANFTKLAATAKRLINKNGREVSIVKLNTTPADPARPWRGPNNPRTGGATVVAKAAFVPLGGSNLGITFQDAAPDSEVMLFAADDDEGNFLENFDEVIDGTARWAIGQVQVLQPADKRLLYFFLVES